jgi:hypothetical protein
MPIHKPNSPPPIVTDHPIVERVASIKSACTMVQPVHSRPDHSRQWSRHQVIVGTMPDGADLIAAAANRAVARHPPQSVAACLSIVPRRILSRMGTESRKTIYGASIRAAAERAAQARKEADRLACEAWNKRMLGFQGPAQPSPTLGDAINAGFGYLEVKWAATRIRLLPSISCGDRR